MTGRLLFGNLEVGRHNYREVCRKFCLPYCFFENQLNGFTIPDTDNIGFYDIETDSQENFLFGYVNETRFSDPGLMCRALRAFPIVVSFNGFRFDNRILHGLCPDSFNVRRIGNFECFLVRNSLNIDALLFYKLWRPFRNSHKLDLLAGDLGIERKAGLDDKERKCLEDVKVMKGFWPYLKSIMMWFYDNFSLDPEYLSSLSAFHLSKLRRWCLQIHLLRQGIMPELVKRKYRKERPGFFKYCKRGFYRDMNVFDVKSAYPRTAINLGCTLYEQGDFSRFEGWLLNERRRCQEVINKYEKQGKLDDRKR